VERITGFSPIEVIGQKAGGRENWGGQMQPAIYKKMWTTIKVEKKPFSGELVNIKKDGQLYNVFATITPVLDKDGEVQFFLGIERDITREKMIDKAKSEFVSLASHQLRTPLSAINWYTEMLLDGDAGPLTKEQKEYLHEIYTGNQRMVDLVTSLLNVSRLELGTFAIEPTEGDLVAMSQNAIKELTPLITAKKLQVTETYGKVPPICVDKKLMYMIFQNIYSNAVKYNPEGGKITVGIAIDKKKVIITATDTGMGIPKEEQGQIFTKLFRANNAKDSVTEGTGLGLYIVKSILDQAGGKISFTSEVNKGTTFTVTLPLTGMKPKDGTKKLT
jgi:PAS domain S-box-containing protein